jgi:hypothetical protein
MILRFVKNWAPFRIDALGLVTMLGAAEVDICIGRLVHNCIIEWLPILGAYTVVSGQISRPIPGFVLYNITDGVMATDLCCWLTRWLVSLPLTYTASILEVRQKAKHLPSKRKTAARCIGLAVFLPIVTLAVVTADWWGLANAIAMALSVVVRRTIVGQHRQAIDAVMERNQRGDDQDVKLFITIPSGKSVTMYAPRKVVVHCFLTEPRPPRLHLYRAMQAIGWASFGIHVVALGMSCLFNQIISVIVLVGSSIIAVSQHGDFQTLIGTKLDFNITWGDADETRTAVYSRLNLSTQEEESMIQWNMFPHKSNSFWWQKYRTMVGKSSGVSTTKSNPQQPTQPSAHSAMQPLNQSLACSAQD